MTVNFCKARELSDCALKRQIVNYAVVILRKI